MKHILACFTLASLLAFVLAAAQPQRRPDLSRNNLAQGKTLYNNQCALCHGIEGTGGKGPALNLPKLPRAATLAELAKVIAGGIEGTEMSAFWTLNEREVRQVAAYVRSLGQVQYAKLTGNAARGQPLFEKQCANCHIVDGKGGVSGPELTEIGTRRSAAYLRDAIIEPNNTVPEGYLVVSVMTADGQRVRGVRVNEDPFSIQLRDAANRYHSFRKAELREIKKEFGVSTMPSYKEAFSATELDNLIAYLASLRGEK